MTALNFLKTFSSKRYSSDMLTNIEHVLNFCDQVQNRTIYITDSEEFDHRLMWAFTQSIKVLGFNYFITNPSVLLANYEKWVSSLKVNESIVIGEIGARMLSYLHNSLYDIRYYRKLFAEFSYYRYIKELKKPKPTVKKHI
jgi:hypothetical protein